MKVSQEELAALRSGKKIPRRSGDYWSKEEQEELQQKFIMGVGISELALLYERGEPAIVQQVTKAGLMEQQCKPRTRKPKNTGETQCLCPTCNVSDCPNCGKECAYAGRI